MSHPDPLADAIVHLHAASVARDPTAEAAALAKLYAAVRARASCILRRGARSADTDDLAQVAVCRIARALRTGPVLDRPGAWASIVVRNAACDELRARRRRRATDDAEAIAQAFDALALKRFEEAARRRDDDEVRQRLVAAVAAYAEAADRRPPTARGHHVRAWYMMAVEKRTGAEARDALLTECGKPVSAPCLWKWAERGRALVAALATEDADPERGEMMRRAAELTARAAA